MEVTSGITTAPEVVFRIERQPFVRPVAESCVAVHPEAPMYRRLLLATTILRWRPLVMVVAADTALVPVLIVCTVPWAPAEGEPAINKLLPLSTPTVAAATGIGAPKTGAAGLEKLTLITLAVVPPHSDPQFRIKAVLSPVSVVSNTAVNG